MWRSINCNYTSKYMLYVDWRTRSTRITGAVQVITDLMNCYKFLIISWVLKYQVVKPYLPYSSKTVYYRSLLAGVLSGWEAGNNCPLEKYLSKFIKLMLCFLLFRVGVKKILYSTKKEKQDITLLAQQTKRRKQHKMIFLLFTYMFGQCIFNSIYRNNWKWMLFFFFNLFNSFVPSSFLSFFFNQLWAWSISMI